MLITGKIVIVDDEDMVIKTLKTLLKIEGFSNVNIFNDPSLALEFIEKKSMRAYNFRFHYAKDEWY